MSQKQYTTEEIVRLYGMYQPKEVMYKGEKIDVRAIGICRNNILADARNKNLLWWVGITDCRLILRPISSLTEQELQEFGKWMMCEAARDCTITNGGYCEVSYAINEDGDLDCYAFNIDQHMPLLAAQFFFSKQINFLNLPADIAVVYNTNDTEI